MSKITIEIDREQASDLSYWITNGVLDRIRLDEEVDLILWIGFWAKLVEKLEKVK